MLTINPFLAPVNLIDLVGKHLDIVYVHGDGTVTVKYITNYYRVDPQILSRVPNTKEGLAWKRAEFEESINN